MGRPAENVQHVTHTVTRGVHQVVTLLGNTLLVADGVECIHHKVHRHDVDPPALQAHHGHPGRQQLAHTLDEFEEVVRAVDLVHLAVGAVTHHHGGPVHRPRHLALLAHDAFTLVFGHEVRVVVVLGLLEHVFAEDAFVQTGGGDGRHMVEVPRVNGLGQLDGVAGAVDVHGHLAFFVRIQVVHGGQVVDMAHSAFQLLDVVRGNTQLLRRQVAKHRHRTCRAHAPVAAQIGHLGRTFLAQQEVDHRAFALQQLLHKTFANKTCCPCHEILHANLRIERGFLPKAGLPPFSTNPHWGYTPRLRGTACPLLLPPCRGQHQPPGKAGSTVFLE